VNDHSIVLDDVWLAYRLSRNPVNSFKEFLIRLVKRQVQYESLWALQGVSFSVSRGEVVGVIGPNGAGKSSLMKLIARVLPPTRGRVRVRGSVAPMIELGAGFNIELTAYENILLYGTILGRSTVIMRERAEHILDWAELTEYRDVPLRSFSSGMLARLGFSVAVDDAPDVLVVDEVLSVGDQAFQRRSKERIEEMIRGGTAVVLVSHSLPSVLELADRVVWLSQGSLVMQGAPEAVVNAYRATA
jgi:ABC-2 type transport system ATP-binding protein